MSQSKRSKKNAKRLRKRSKQDDRYTKVCGWCGDIFRTSDESKRYCVSTCTTKHEANQKKRQEEEQDRRALRKVANEGMRASGTFLFEIPGE